MRGPNRQANHPTFSQAILGTSFELTVCPTGILNSSTGITEAYKKDSLPEKINLGVGAYRTSFGHDSRFLAHNGCRRR